MVKFRVRCQCLFSDPHSVS
uniref:Uncharacterized protein n=1 Tax=Rhizophora mucronata TaxID=61149 RepID=A0A2P2QPZ8_RHIMU